MSEAAPTVSMRVYEGSLAARVTACITLPLVGYLCLVGGQAIADGRAVEHVPWLTLMLAQWLESFGHAFDRLEISGDRCVVGRFRRRQFDLSRVVRWSVGVEGDIRFDTTEGSVHASSQGVQARGGLLRTLLERIPEPPFLERGWTSTRAAVLVIGLGIPTVVFAVRAFVAGDTAWDGPTSAVAIAVGIGGVAGVALGRWNPQRQAIPNAFQLYAPTFTMTTALFNLGFCVPMVVRTPSEQTQHPLELIWFVPPLVFGCAFWLSRRFWPSRTTTEFVLNLDDR